MNKNKENKKLEEIRKNPYIVFTIALGLLSLFLIISNIYKIETEKKSENEILCSVISGTPAWAMNGKILDYGVKIPEDMSIDLVNSILIPQGIKFLYNPNCGHCEAQIDYFKEQGNWEEYKKEGLVIDCSEYW